MTCDLHCRKHLGVHEKHRRRNIFGRMFVSVTYLDWRGGQDYVWFCHFVLLSLDVTMCVTLWEMVSVQSPLARGRSEPSPPHQ